MGGKDDEGKPVPGNVVLDCSVGGRGGRGEREPDCEVEGGGMTACGCDSIRPRCVVILPSPSNRGDCSILVGDAEGVDCTDMLAGGVRNEPPLAERV